MSGLLPGIIVRNFQDKFTCFSKIMFLFRWNHVLRRQSRTATQAWQTIAGAQFLFRQQCRTVVRRQGCQVFKHASIFVSFDTSSVVCVALCCVWKDTIFVMNFHTVAFTFHSGFSSPAWKKHFVLKHFWENTSCLSSCFPSAHVSSNNNFIQCSQMVIGRLSRNAIQAWQTIAAAMFCLVCYVGQLYACKAVRFRSCYVLFVLHFPVVRLILLYLECDVHIWNSHVLMPVHLFVLHFAVFGMKLFSSWSSIQLPSSMLFL